MRYGTLPGCTCFALEIPIMVGAVATHALLSPRWDTGLFVNIHRDLLREEILLDGSGRRVLSTTRK